MARVQLVSLVVLVAAVTSQHCDNTTLGEVYHRELGTEIYKWTFRGVSKGVSQVFYPKEYIENILNLFELKTDINEIQDYFREINTRIAQRFPLSLSRVRVNEIYNVLNENCSQGPETRIQDLTVEPRGNECVKERLVKWLTSRLENVIGVSVKEVSARCAILNHHICSPDKLNCTLAFAVRAASLLRNLTIDYYDGSPWTAVTPLRIIEEYLERGHDSRSISLTRSLGFLQFIKCSLISAPSIPKYNKPPMIDEVLPTSFFLTDNISMSHDKFSWGVVRSNTGTFKLPCSSYRHSKNSSRFLDYLRTCNSLTLVRQMMQYIRCANRNSTLSFLTWSTTHPVYFHSQCLCFAFNGYQCGVKAPSEVDPSLYCLSVLLRDFQRRVSHRPAITYLDYALKTRVPLCKITNLLAVSFSAVCHDIAVNKTYFDIFSVKCWFAGLVNAELNCPRTLPVNPRNLTELCLAKIFTQLVVCDDVDAGDEVLVPYYAAGDSPVVHVLTYVDVVVRVVTLVTYLACPQLRNLPGKLLIAYLTTALLRLVLVRATVEDLPLAVRLDVYLDLASTLCLTAYNQFLTSSFKALRPPDSLTRDDVRQVLLRYALLGWASPSILSTAFFCVDEFLDSPVQIGQLLFVLSNYVALLYNLYLFHGAYSCYHDYKTDTHFLRRDAKTRGVYRDLFVFALKTSVLSGAGIILRLVFTQIQGLEHVLGYYHALGTLQGLLIFLLYGCNVEARVFWLGIGSSTLRRFRRRRDSSSRRRDVMEIAPIRHL